MNPTTHDLCRRGEQLGARLAPAELANVPVYVLPQSRLPFDLGADSVCHGYPIYCVACGRATFSSGSNHIPNAAQPQTK